jgi:hypothetical protein
MKHWVLGFQLNVLDAGQTRESSLTAKRVMPFERRNLAALLVPSVSIPMRSASVPVVAYFNLRASSSAMPKVLISRALSLDKGGEA